MHLVQEALQPVQAISNRIEDILVRLTKNHTTDFTALHIRRTDLNKRYESDVLFADYAFNIMMSNEIRNSQLIYPATDNRISMATVTNALKKGTVIVGGTYDNKPVKKSLRRKEHMPPLGHRHTPLSDAIVDIWVCQRARWFQGTLHSSFSGFINLLRDYNGYVQGNLI